MTQSPDLPTSVRVALAQAARQRHARFVSRLRWAAVAFAASGVASFIVTISQPGV